MATPSSSPSLGPRPPISTVPDLCLLRDKLSQIAVGRDDSDEEPIPPPRRVTPHFQVFPIDQVHSMTPPSSPQPRSLLRSHFQSKCVHDHVATSPSSIANTLAISQPMSSEAPPYTPSLRKRKSFHMDESSDGHVEDQRLRKMPSHREIRFVEDENDMSRRSRSQSCYENGSELKRGEKDVRMEQDDPPRLLPPRFTLGKHGQVPACS